MKTKKYSEQFKNDNDKYYDFSSQYNDVEIFDDFEENLTNEQQEKSRQFILRETSIILTNAYEDAGVYGFMKALYDLMQFNADDAKFDQIINDIVTNNI